MINLIIHNWKGFKKGRTFYTIGFISIVNQDVFKMFDIAAKKLEIFLGYKKQSYDIKFGKRKK